MNLRIRNPKSLLLLLSLLWVTPLDSQALNWDLNMHQTYSTNPFRTISAEKSWISTAEFGLASQIHAVQLRYSGSLSAFNQRESRNFYWHIAQLSYRDSLLYTTVSLEQRINRTSFNYYDYTAGHLLISRLVEFPVGDGYFRGNLAYYAYPELPEYENLQINFGVQWNTTFPTRTTLISNAGVNQKIYLDKTNLQSQAHIPNSTQLTWSLRLAQGVAARTGIAAQYQYRHVFSTTEPTNQYLVYQLAQESAIFDDPITYQGSSWGLELTQLFPWYIMSRISAYQFFKQYPEQPLYIDDSTYHPSQTRHDRLSTVWITVEKPIVLQTLQHSEFTLLLTYQWTDNRSNSYWYDYTVHYGSLGIEYHF